MNGNKKNGIHNFALFNFFNKVHLTQKIEPILEWLPT